MSANRIISQAEYNALCGAADENIALRRRLAVERAMPWFAIGVAFVMGFAICWVLTKAVGP